jgi:transcriptional regulator with XRE-family HTH domain
MKSHFGLYMRQMRQLSRHTPESLARAIGCEKSLIDLVEQNARDIPVNLLNVWAGELHLHPKEIILVYLNQKARTMILGAGLDEFDFFKVVPATQEEVYLTVEASYGMDSSHELELR